MKPLTFGGFTLTKLVKNVPYFSSQFQHDRKSPEIDSKVLPTVADSSHVLGLRCSLRADTLVVSRGTSPNLNTAIIRRVVLSVVLSVYDPIGLVAPYVKARLLLMDIWRKDGQQWDDALAEAFITQFLEWSKKLPLLSEIAIPRSYFQETVEGLELHMFTKRTETTDLAFVFGEAAVAPMKCPTIPKLELQATLLVSRL